MTRLRPPSIPRARQTVSEGLVEIAWLLAMYARKMAVKDARFKVFVGRFARIAKAFGRVAAKGRGKKKPGAVD